MARRIQRVTPLLLKEEKNKNDYIPKAVSIGPYHHGKPELAPVEAFKPIAVNLFVSGGPQNVDFYYSELLGIIGEIRQCYCYQDIDYADDVLARLMLQDACFIINYMELCTQYTARLENSLAWFKTVTMVKHLGLLEYTIVLRDMFLLENQIPLRVIKLLINLRYEEAVYEYENLLHRYLNFSLSIVYGHRQKRVLNMEIDGEEPLHLLEAFHRLLIPAKLNKTLTDGGSDLKMAAVAPAEISGFMIMAAALPAITNPYHPSARGISRWLCCPRSRCFDIECGVGPTMISGRQGMILGLLLRTLACKKAAKNPKKEKVIHSFRSVTDLKAKGIHFKPCPTNSLEDIDFKSHFLYATLQLPYLEVNIYTKAFFLNMVAYELSPSSSTKCEVTSYINFMKSLLERPEDVKELRDKKILCNKLGSDQEVLRVYKDINTYGADNSEVFGELKDKIQAHYQSYTKTWMAELIHTYFRTPWTIIAFLGAISLLALTAAQVQYAIHPN